MRGIYSKKATIVMIYSYDIYTELKKHYKKDGKYTAKQIYQKSYGTIYMRY